MTRETKIGLLVGLAFIIVIGILLSDHLTSSTEPPQAPLARVGDTVRQTVTTPGGVHQPLTAVTPPTDVTPTATVPTRQDLTSQQPVRIIAVGPGPQEPVSIQQQVPQPESVAQTPVIDQRLPITRSLEPTTPVTPLEQVAQQHGEPIVVLNQPPSSTAQPASTGHAGGFREHVAEPGDSLSKMAARYFGSNTKAHRDAIIRANPSLADNPNLIVVGRTYRIPVNASTPNPLPQQQAVQARDVQRPTGGEYWYTVKPGDSLWKIATEQLGSGAAVAAIKELNADTLKGRDVVTVGMKLKLPGRPIARVD